MTSDRGYGWVPDLPDHRDRRLTFRRMALSPSVDLSAGMPPVYDQGALGSCTANAVAAAMEFNRIRQKFHRYTPSRLFIYYCEREMEGTVDSDAGAMIRDGIKVVNSTGAPAEEHWPYDMGQFKVRPNAYAYEVAPYDAALAYARVDQTVDAMRACLASGVPFVFGFTVYESFESPAVAATGLVPMPGPNEGVLGGHAVTAVGYDDASRVVMVRNSWGPSWGRGGHFLMPYDYIANNNLADDFWQISHIGHAHA